MTRPRGRPRLAETDAAILRATLELLADEGLQGLAVERVAALAGVAKTTIYRRYSTKQELATAALETLAMGVAGSLGIDTGTARGDLLELIRRRVATQPETRWNLLMPRLVVESAADPELHALVRRILVDPERERVAAIVRRGSERGELPAGLDPEFAVDVLIGPLVYRILIDRGSLDGLADRLARVFDLLAASR